MSSSSTPPDCANPHVTLNLENMRLDYNLDSLAEKHAEACPLDQFALWLSDAVKSEGPPSEPNAMNLATVGPDGRPHSRIVLLKDVMAGSFRFFTNYESQKGHDLVATPFAALTFYWPTLHRQVRIEGRVEKIPEKASDEYYNVRPLGSRLGAWASRQSTVIQGREQLEEQYKEIAERFKGQDKPPRPEFWGGYAVIPDRIEFWQGRRSRLHDRLNYRLVDGSWVMERLSP